MTGRLDGKVALITGGAGGQGAAEARLFAQEGAAVVVADIKDDDGERVVASLAGSGGCYLSLDVTRLEDWESAARVVESRFGRLDVLVNNAGIPAGFAGRFDRLPLESHHAMFDVHVHGTFYGMRTMLPLLEASPAASVINISSIDGLVGVMGLASYTASKFAVTALTRSAAIDLGPLGIRVNSIHPGIIETPLLAQISEERRQRLAKTLDRQPIRRAGRPEEVAPLALFLASDESSYCTGAQFTVDGGHLAGPYRDPVG